MANNGGIFHRLNEFRTSHAGVILFYGYLIAVFVAATFFVVGYVRLNRIAAQNHRVLCNQKQGYETTFKNAKAYLKKHPHGTQDFSQDVIVAAILQSKVQLKAFNDVNCTTP
jgi:hypothetical protein